MSYFGRVVFGRVVFGLNCPDSAHCNTQDLDLINLFLTILASLVYFNLQPSGMIKSDSPTPLATDFWGRASEKLPPARPRTSVFYGQSCPKLMSFKQ